jgi:hypothetical protein
MRLFVLLSLVLLLVAAASTGYFVYRQVDTRTVTLAAPLDMPQGSACGATQLTVKARTLGRWSFSLSEGQGAAVSVSVDGRETADIGLRVWSPNNHIVYAAQERFHTVEFTLAAEVRGDYTFEFDNRHSTFTEKRLAVSVCFS